MDTELKLDPESPEMREALIEAAEATSRVVIMQLRSVLPDLVEQVGKTTCLSRYAALRNLDPEQIVELGSKAHAVADACRTLAIAAISVKAMREGNFHACTDTDACDHPIHKLEGLEGAVVGEMGVKLSDKGLVN